MDVLSACMYVHHECARFTQKSEEGNGFPELEWQTPVSHYVGAGDPAWVLYQEESVPLTVVGSLSNGHAYEVGPS